ncbi:MAG TPA: MarR family transcriptional regulator [Pseudonocardiaceae bacterium]|jgi:DNA-binding MarR family transcriptional regulator
MNDARWLSDQEQGVWRRYLAATGAVNDELERQLQRDSGLPHAYYEVLVSLSEAPDRTLRMSELAERSRSSRSRMSHAVARLEQAGLIERTGCPSDKRGAFAVLTEKGYSALVDAAPGHVNAVRGVLFDTLTPTQVQQLSEICSAIIGGKPAPADKSE